MGTGGAAAAAGGGGGVGAEAKSSCHHSQGALSAKAGGVKKLQLYWTLKKDWT